MESFVWDWENETMKFLKNLRVFTTPLTVSHTSNHDYTFKQEISLESKRRGSRSKRRRRPRRGRRRSKSRRRRYSTDEEDETEGNTDTDRSFTKSPEPQDKSRKRRKSRRKGRRARRRYRRRGADSDEVDSDRSSPTNQGRSGPPEEKRSDQDKLSAFCCPLKNNCLSNHS